MTDPNPTEFEVDLRYLDQAARSFMPDMARTYQDSAKMVASVADSDAAMFGGCGDAAGPGLQGAFYSSWAELRDALNRAMKDTGDLTSAAADALLHVISTYAESDTDAQQYLRATERNHWSD